MPLEHLGGILDRAIQHDIARDHALCATGSLQIDIPTARMLLWLLRHDPARAIYSIRDAIGECERDLGIDRRRLRSALRMGLVNIGPIDDDVLDRAIKVIEDAIPDKS